MLLMTLSLMAEGLCRAEPGYANIVFYPSIVLAVSATLRRLLVRSGYVEVGSMGPFQVLVREEGRPGCLYVAEDWPMILAFRRGGGLRAVTLEDLPPSLRPPIDVLVRRSDDLEPIGQARLGEDLQVSPSLPVRGTWALLDPITPLGVDVPTVVADAVVASGVKEVIVARYYTSQLSARLLRSYRAPKGPLLIPVINVVDDKARVELSVLWGAKPGLSYADPYLAAQAITRALEKGC